MLYKTRQYMETEREQFDGLISLLTQSQLSHVGDCHSTID